MGWIPFERKGDYDDYDYRTHRVRRLCIALFLLLLLLLFLLGLAALITYLVLRPRATRSVVVSAAVPTLTSSPLITAYFLYGVELRNPNRRVTFSYDKLHLQTTYLGVDIGHSGIALGRPRVRPRGVYVASVATGVQGLAVSSIVADALRGDIARGSVAVRVTIDVRTRAHVGSYTSFWVWVRSVCDVAVTPPVGAVAGTLLRADCRNT